MSRACRQLLCVTLTAALVGGFAGAAAAKPPAAGAGVEKPWHPFAPFTPTALRAEVEPNDSLRLANPLDCGDVLSPAAISPRKDRDFVVFTVDAGETIALGTDADGVNGQLEDTVVTLFGAGGDSLASDDDSGPGRYSLLVYTAPATGTYYARIAAYDTLSSGAYRAFLRCTPPPAVNCGLAAYDSVTQVLPAPLPIPDGIPGGVTLGPLSVPNDGQFLRDVVLALRIQHTFIGDLTATLTYDVNCDGTPEATARVLCRPGRSGCQTGADLGCPANLNCGQTVFLSDAATVELGTVPLGCGDTEYVVSSGCYHPSATGEPLSTFARLARGGCFRLILADWITFDSGNVCEWRVYMASAATSAQPASWSTVKQLYR